MIEYNKEIKNKLDNGTGYLYFIDKDHPLATGNSNRVYLHRHVASIAVGRWLTTEEQVHHIDENKLNNVASNLEILSAKEHALKHNPENNKISLCPVCGEIFEHYASTYRINCSEACRIRASLKVVIDKDTLENLLWHYPATYIGKLYGLSDKGVIKKAKSMGCKMPPPYFHNKSSKYREEQRLLNNMRPTPPTVF